MNWLYQCKFEILRQIRNRTFIIFSLLMPVGYYFLFGHIYGNEKIGTVGFQSYYLMSMGAFSVIGSAISGTSIKIAFERTEGWIKLIQTTPLHSGAYVSCKVVAQLFVNAMIIIILFLAARFIQGVQLTFTQWSLSFLWLTIGSLLFIVLGMLIGLAVGVDAANTISTIIYLIISVAGGLWFPVEMFPNWLKEIAHILPSYRLANVCWDILANQVPSLLDFAVPAIYLVVLSGISLIVLKHTRELDA